MQWKLELSKCHFAATYYIIKVFPFNHICVGHCLFIIYDAKTKYKAQLKYNMSAGAGCLILWDYWSLAIKQWPPKSICCFASRPAMKSETIYPAPHGDYTALTPPLQLA